MVGVVLHNREIEIRGNRIMINRITDSLAQKIVKSSGLLLRMHRTVQGKRVYNW